MVSKCIADMINLSMPTGKVSIQFIIARVTPVLKNKGSPFDYCNYRPISCIPHVAKVMERVLHKQLKSIYLNTNLLQEIRPLIILVTLQKTALHRIMLDLLERANDRLYSGICVFDLAKCFYTIDHDILSIKLQKYGISRTELPRFNIHCTLLGVGNSRKS